MIVQSFGFASGRSTTSCTSA